MELRVAGLAAGLAHAGLVLSLGPDLHLAEPEPVAAVLARAG